jgi:hypothetical protein
MGRLHHLKRTLPRNIVWNQDYPDLEFLLLDYNSPDGLEGWVRHKMAKYIESGRLVYCRESSAKHFLHSHSRNLAFKLATGDIVCNVDADNFTGAGFAAHLDDVFGQRTRLICGGMNVSGLFGRIALRKEDFLNLGGYDEQFTEGWGLEDWDLIRRAICSGFARVSFGAEYAISAIGHSNTERQIYTQAGNLWDSRRSIEQKSERNVSEGRLVANLGRLWGCGAVIKNFKEEIQVA